MCVASFRVAQRQIDFGDYLPQEIVEGAQIFNDNYEMNMPDLLVSASGDMPPQVL